MSKPVDPVPLPAIDTDAHPPITRPTPAPTPALTPAPAPTPAPPRFDTRPHTVESDYLPWDDDPPYPHPLVQQSNLTHPPPSSPPLDPILLVHRALSFESTRSALHASAMILLLKPLLPQAIDDNQARAILRHHHSRLMRMNLVVEAALLRKLCVPDRPDRLTGWSPSDYTAVFAPAQTAVKAALLCPGCRKPREIDASRGPDAVWTCERCRLIMAPCAVCGHRLPERPAAMPDEISHVETNADPPVYLAGWWSCPGCSHGGHASCLQMWHALCTPPSPPPETPSRFSSGCCPLDGCGHACLPGRYRGEAASARADDLARAVLDASRPSREDVPDTTTTNHPSDNSTTNPLPQPPQPPAAAPPPPSLPPPPQQSSSPPVRSIMLGGGGGGGSRRPSPHLSSVRGDVNDVPPSLAVSVARDALGRRASPARDRRKGVKFARSSEA